MKSFTGRASAHLDASAAVVFDLVTDIDRLPRWNRAIEEVVDRPAVLAPGTEWTVRMHPPHLPSWCSTSQVSELDRDRHRFAYVTRNADGNPSRVAWAWMVESAGDGCDVTVSWSCHLATLDRRLFAGPLRKRHLAREVPTSLVALADVLALR